MVHDIELLAGHDERSRRQLPGLPEDWLPFHRCDGVVHAVDLSPEAYGEVHALPGGAPCGDITVFLAERLTPEA